MSKLTEKQQAFADFYIESLNATESYSKAYMKDNRRTCEVEGCKLLRNPKIREYIDSVLDIVKGHRIATIQEIMQFHTDVMNNEYKKLGYNKPLYLKDRQTSAEALTRRYELSSKDIDDSIKIKIVKASEKDE